MSLFLYETHLHTKEASACATLDGAEHARKYKKAGYAGIIVTDHFFNGNSCIPQNLPWEERIDRFCLGYEHAREEGDRIGLDVFFGVEMGFNFTEFLVYGIDKAWLKKQPDLLSWTVEEQFRKVHEAGGFIVHAHPYRIRSYIKEVCLFPNYIDAVEIFNAGNGNGEFDKKAEAYAKKLKLPGTAGTDAHGHEKRHSGMAFRHRIENIHEFIDSVKSGHYELLKIQYE